MSSLASTLPEAPTAHKRSPFLLLSLGALGVVFGDIGTSPLYAMKEALKHSRPGEGDLATFGVISLVFWTLLLLVTVKYVIFLMRADNRGEGGTLALMALAQSALGRHSRTLLMLGLCGAALFYGDSLITPALSVLSAIEGLKGAPGIGHGLDDAVLPLTFAILFVLFLVQSHGTAKVAGFFGPVMLIWFAVIGGMGLIYIAQKPEILAALNPLYGAKFLLANGFTGFVVLGSVFLVVTGAEALYADMGHFGRNPIGAAWLFAAFPGLMLNYLGQGALTLIDPSAAADPFWRMVPDVLYWPILVLAAVATVIASQAVISGAFSMSQQAVQLGLLPRMEVRRTSETEAGQIYMPQVNVLLMIGVLFLVAAFRSSDGLTSAYGIAVTGTMLTSTLLAWVVIRRGWGWSPARTLALLIPLGLIEAVFLVSNLTKFLSGAWLPLAFGGVVMGIMLTWTRGTRLLAAKAHRESLPLNDLIAMLTNRPPHHVEGTAIFLTGDPAAAPGALMHNLKHNKMLHQRNIILSVHTAETPRVADADRIAVQRINDDFTLLSVTYGFMEAPDVPAALALARSHGLNVDVNTATFFLGRKTVAPTLRTGFQRLRDLLFAFLSRNAVNPTEWFHIPPNRVVELGAQVMI